MNKKIQWLYKPTFTSLGGTILYFSFAHLPFALPCRKPWQGQVFLLTVQGWPKPQGLPLHHVRPRETGLGGLLRGLPGRFGAAKGPFGNPKSGIRSDMIFFDI